MHISELAQHHVENPREVVSQGQAVNVKIIEIDGERRRLSLSLKRVEDTDPVQPRADGGESVHLAAVDRPLGGRLRRRRPSCPSSPESRRRTARPRPRTKPTRRRADEEAPERSGRPPRLGAEVGRRGLAAAEAPTCRGSRSVQLRGVTRPVAVAITGGIGAGKSEALRAFARHGAATVSSDEIVHELLRRDERQEAVVERLGQRRRRARRRARPRRDRDRRLQRPERARLARGAAAPARLAGVPALARAARRLPKRPGVCVTEVPLLYEAGGDRSSTRSS